MHPRRPCAALLAVSALLVAGCGSSAGSSSSGGTSTKPEGLEGGITVSAASSLTEAFDELGADFHAAHPNATVRATYDSSTVLSSQIIEGAPADLFASADEANMAALTAKDLVAGKPEDFARNKLVIVTKPGNPEGITTLADLAGAGVVSLCGKDVPCGMFAQQVLDKAHVTIDEGSITRGQNAKATLTAVTEGDAVAGIVYVTDARAAGAKVDAVPIPGNVNVIATYPIAVLKGARDASVAQAFEDYVLSAAGQATLKEFGFLARR